MKHLSEHQQGLIAIFFAAILWSSGGLLVKLITLTPMQISFFRCAVAAATFGIIFRKKILKVKPAITAMVKITPRKAASKGQ